MRMDDRYAIMHDKFIVVDGETVQEGSFNYTVAAESKNAESVLVLHDASVAANYGNILFLIKQEDRLSAAAQKYLSTAEQEIARVSQIATQTLRFHSQSTKPREISMDELIESVVSLYQGRLSNSNIEIIQSVPWSPSN